MSRLNFIEFVNENSQRLDMTIWSVLKFRLLRHATSNQTIFAFNLANLAMTKVREFIFSSFSVFASLRGRHLKSNFNFCEAGRSNLKLTLKC